MAKARARQARARDQHLHLLVVVAPERHRRQDRRLRLAAAGALNRTDRRSTHLEDELAPEVARLAQPMRLGSIGQAIELDLRGAYRPCVYELVDALEMPPG